jgi:hypothetical protein
VRRADWVFLCQGHIPQNFWHLIKVEKLTLKTRHKWKLCDQLCGHSTSGWFWDINANTWLYIHTHTRALPAHISFKAIPARKNWFSTLTWIVVCWRIFVQMKWQLVTDRRCCDAKNLNTKLYLRSDLVFKRQTSERLPAPWLTSGPLAYFYTAIISSLTSRTVLLCEATQTPYTQQHMSLQWNAVKACTV